MKPFKLNLGINNVSNADYHRDTEYLSSSVLKTILEDPAKYYTDYILGEKVYEEKPHLDLGTLAHSLVLEPHTVNEEFAFFPGFRRSGAAFDAFRLANPGKKIMTTATLQTAQALARSVEARPQAKALLHNGHPEQSICVNIYDVPLKIRCDYISASTAGGHIADIKTSRHESGINGFKEAMTQWDYGLSAALYTMVAEQFYGAPLSFYFLVLSKLDFTCEVYRASDKTLAAGKERVYKALDLYKQCKKSGIWQAEKTTETSVQLEPEYEILEV